MNLKTTLALVVLLGAAALVYVGGDRWPGRPEPAPASADDPSIPPENITKIVIRDVHQDKLKGKHEVTLERAGQEWRLAGGWATRPAEVRKVLDVLGNLRSRFAPEAFPDFRRAVSVHVTTKAGTTTLTFGEKKGDDSTRFDRPTYLQVGEAGVVTRLAPGLVDLLDRPADHYQQRRLFPTKRELKEETGTARVERVVGTELMAEENGQMVYAIRQGKDGWELSYPLRDALDPRTRDQLLEGVADLWAEKFVEKAPEKFTVEKRLTLTREDGTKLTLEIGPEVPGSAAPPKVPPLPGSPPEDRGRNYARLVGNERVFEVSSAKFNDIFPRLDALREGQLARFTAADARELTLTTSKGKVVLRNQAPRKPAGDGVPPPADWRIVEPKAAKADSAAVDKLLQALSGLPALDRDAGLKARVGAAVGALSGGLAAPWFASPDRATNLLGVDPPSATIEVKVEEGSIEAPKHKTVTLALGRLDADAKKLFATSGDWPRVNEIEASVGEQVIGKGPLDFRGKKVLELSAGDVEGGKGISILTRTLSPGLTLIGASPLSAAVALGAAGDRFAEVELAKHTDGHFVRKPVVTPADASKFSDLAEKLAGLEALAWVDEIEKDRSPRYELVYGLDRPTVEATFAGRVLLVGRPRGEGPGWYARIKDTPEVFVLPNEVVEMLRRDSLAYLPAQLWTVNADEITEFTIARDGQPPYRIVRKGEAWQVTGPFTVAAPKEVVDGLVKALAAPRAEEYRAHAAADRKPFGLEKPAVAVTVKTVTGKEHTLSLGGDADPGRFAMVGKGGVFVAGEELAKAADRNALDFLDRTLLKLDAAAVSSFQRQKGPDVLAMEKKDDAWRIVKPAEQPADERKVKELLDLASGLKAERLAAYAPKDVKAFGLDAPFATVTLGKDVLVLGGEVAGTGERYAQVKGGPAVGVLSARTVQRLLAGPLAYRDHLLARVPDADEMRLEMGERKVTFGKPEGSWRLTAPLNGEADHDALEGLLNGLARLRADELISEKPAAADVKKFGLERPVARWVLMLDGKAALDLSVGAPEPAGPRRYARLAGSELVFLLDAKLSGQVLAEYRPRTVFKDIDPAQIEAVRFGHKEGAFELRKSGADWEVVGKPDVKVNATAVSDALAALRDLKLERYVKDDGAQLKLYGLAPADLVLEVTTPDGKEVLHLGGVEGSSKRRYARLPRPKPADVFVLDEAASGKLYRTLADLTAK